MFEHMEDIRLADVEMCHIKVCFRLLPNFSFVFVTHQNDF